MRNSVSQKLLIWNFYITGVESGPVLKFFVVSHTEADRSFQDSTGLIIKNPYYTGMLFQWHCSIFSLAMHARMP